TSNDVIGVIDTDAKGTQPAAAQGSAPPPSAPLTKPAASPPKQSAQPAPAVEPAPAMPAARKMMADKGVDATTVTGTGRGNRITKEDVAAAVEAKSAPAAPTPKPAAPPAQSAPPVAKPSIPPVSLPALGSRPEQRVPMSRLRQRVAERLVQSQSTAAILTTFNEV